MLDQVCVCVSTPLLIKNCISLHSCDTFVFAFSLPPEPYKSFLIIVLKFDLTLLPNINWALHDIKCSP